MKGVRSVSRFTFLRVDVQVLQQHLLKRPSWLHPLPLPLCQRSTDYVYRGPFTSLVLVLVSSVPPGNCSILFTVLAGRGFLRLPSGSCYGNSSAGEEASVSIPPAARCPCPSWTWEWTGAQCRLPLGLRSNRAMMILQCAPPPPGSSVSSDMSTGLQRPLSPFPQGAVDPDRGHQLLRGGQGKASLERARGEALQGLHQGHLAFSHSSCESLALTFVWKLGERLVADVRFRVDGACPASRPGVSAS